MEFINGEQGSKSEIFKRSRKHATPYTLEDHHHCLRLAFRNFPSRNKVVEKACSSLLTVHAMFERYQLKPTLSKK